MEEQLNELNEIIELINQNIEKVKNEVAKLLEGDNSGHGL